MRLNEEGVRSSLFLCFFWISLLSVLVWCSFVSFFMHLLTHFISLNPFSFLSSPCLSHPFSLSLFSFPDLFRTPIPCCCKYTDLQAPTNSLSTTGLIGHLLYQPPLVLRMSKCEWRLHMVETPAVCCTVSKPGSEPTILA